MSRFHLKVTYHTKYQKDIKLNEKKKKGNQDTNAKMREMLELAKWDFKAAILKCFNKQLEACFKHMKNSLSKI